MDVSKQDPGVLQGFTVQEQEKEENIWRKLHPTIPLLEGTKLNIPVP